MDRGSLGTSMNFAIASTADFLSTSSSRMSEGSELELLVPISSQSTRSYNQKVSSAPAVVMATVLPNVGPSSTGRLQVSSNSNKVLMVRPQGSLNSSYLCVGVSVCGCVCVCVCGCGCGCVHCRYYEVFTYFTNYKVDC